MLLPASRERLADDAMGSAEAITGGCRVQGLRKDLGFFQNYSYRILQTS